MKPLCRLWDEILCRCQLGATVVAQSFQEVSKIKGLPRRGLCNHYCTRLVQNLIDSGAKLLAPNPLRVGICSYISTTTSLDIFIEMQDLIIIGLFIWFIGSPSRNVASIHQAPLAQVGICQNCATCGTHQNAWHANLLPATAWQISLNPASLHLGDRGTSRQQSNADVYWCSSACAKASIDVVATYKIWNGTGKKGIQSQQ